MRAFTSGRDMIAIAFMARSLLGAPFGIIQQSETRICWLKVVLILPPLPSGSVSSAWMRPFQAADHVDLAVLQHLRGLRARAPPDEHVRLQLLELLEGAVDIERVELVHRHAVGDQRHLEGIDRDACGRSVDRGSSSYPRTLPSPPAPCPGTPCHASRWQPSRRSAARSAPSGRASSGCRSVPSWSRRRTSRGALPSPAARSCRHPGS